ncbi:MAG TPA: riboflavin synthase [Egibacteraceae bacterium]|nr:riboflavin synthase [Egibacteraceae bacterium]
MFTGIVEELGAVGRLELGGPGAVLTIACATVVGDTRPGDSISVNGCCLTATEVSAEGFAADLMGETLVRTALGTLRAGDPVNLERSLRADGRLGGHLVQGHVDAVAEVVAVEPLGQWTVMTFTQPDGVAPYLVEKGSIAVDGTSLTVMAVDAGTFQVGLIPHTLAGTVLGRRRVGDLVNLEADVVAKYVERLLRSGPVSEAKRDAVARTTPSTGNTRSTDIPPTKEP